MMGEWPIPTWSSVIMGLPQIMGRRTDMSFEE